MAELYLTGTAPDGKHLMIAPITSKKLARCPEPPADTSGYFLMEEDCTGTGVLTILARVSDAEAAFRLGRMFCMS
ncbi:hypothetical protein CLV77_2473 [Brevirhabdus pacifica]|uniref:hypothetical protein n=1 Tax=Brevirhabdus pacifica TaxID=1267768 RepID=UPI000CB61482|nr:hypothetical protein [Brevirhabdus pacifica]PJJ82699.1 hypothetical protein CLV77_2473 [Brevirhabdus pacifica]